MNTPKEFTRNLEGKIITRKMLEECLYSCNKRAKNYRDKEREYRERYGYNDYYHNVEKNRTKKEEQYRYKDLLLTLVNPSCIHREVYIKYYMEKVYGDDEEYDAVADICIDEGCYYDRQEEYYFFYRIVEREEEKEMYYLFYQFENCSFHTPIDKSNLEEYKDLEIIEIEDLFTKGKDINDLISLQFVRKIISLIKSKDYIYIP